MPAETPEAPTKGRSFLVPLLALIVGGVGAFGFTQADTLRTMIGGAPSAAALAGEVPIEYGEFAELDGIVINPADTDGRRYLMIKIGVEAEDAETLARLDILRPAAVDAVVGLMSAQSVARLSDITKRDSLKTEILDRFNRMLGEDGPVTRIYFTQFVLQ